MIIEKKLIIIFFLDEPCPVNLDAYAETHVKQG